MGSQKLQITFDGEALVEIDEIMSISGLQSREEVLMSCIGLYKFYAKWVISNKYKMQVIKGNVIKEVVKVPV